MKKRNLKYWKKKLDRVFSQYIRRRYADELGEVNCVTCGKKDHWKKMQCGHFVPRNILSLRFDERNCNVQCYGCNVAKKGAMDEYALYMVKQYGNGILEELNMEKYKERKITSEEYQDLIDEYTDKLVGLDIRDDYREQENDPFEL